MVHPPMIFPDATTPLAPLLGSDRIIGFDATHDGRIILLTISATTAGRYPLARDPRGERWHFANGRPASPYEAKVIIVDGSRHRCIRLPSLHVWLPRCQLLPDDEILVAEPRCDIRNAKDNAFVHGPDGRLRRSFPVGDGIEHLQTLADGRIWVGYFDEGIFGNDGWSGKPWVREAAKSGLACFAPDGQLHWRYRPPPDCGHLSDCSALNADDTGVWVRGGQAGPSGSALMNILADGSIRYWEPATDYCQSLAIAEDRVLFWDGGMLPEDEVRAALERIEGDELVDRQEVSLILPNGSPLDGRTATVQGRGRYLHALHGTDWHRYDLASPLPE